MLGLDNQRAVITGAGAGIGRAIALRLAREGCDVGLFDLNRRAAEETAAMARELGRKAFVAIGDVAVRADVDRGAAALAEQLGSIDILVNNAGVLRSGPLLEMTDADWRDVFSVNLDGVFHVCQAVLPGMIARRSGVVINIASWAGKRGQPNLAAYSASKFALVGLTQSLAAEVSPLGVRVNAICPGVIVDTQMRDDLEVENQRRGLPDVATRAQSLIPLRRPGYPDDVAGLAAFLASDDAAYMTGQAVNVTGGLWMS